MKYQNLKKLFHIDEKKANELYHNRYESESSRKLGIKIQDNECFFIITEEILNLIDNIYTINSWIDKAFSSNELPESSKEYLIMKSMIEEIRSSNKIEGIYSTRKELQEIVVDKHSDKYPRFYGMVKKYQIIIKEDFPILDSSSSIRNLYDEILLNDIIKEDKQDYPDGVIFRKNPVEISSGTHTIHQGIKSENLIIEMMEKSLKTLNDDSINFLIRIAIFHYLFEYIHPFYTGNGRMGRFIACGYLSRSLNILCAFQLSSACLHSSKQYYDAFDITNDIRNKADLTIFIINFLEIYSSGLIELKESMIHTSEVYKTHLNKLNRYINKEHLTLIKLLLEVSIFGTTGLTMDQLEKITHTSQPTIRKTINTINKQHIFIKKDSTHKPYRYTVDLDLISSL